jgi:hypothetical protein
MFIRRLTGNGAFDITARSRATEASVPPRPTLPARAFVPVASRSRLEDGSAPGQAALRANPQSFGLGNAGRGLERVLEQLAMGLVPASSTGGTTARASGLLDLQSADPGTVSVLASTRAVTERASTERRSVFALGLESLVATASRYTATREVNESATAANPDGAFDDASASGARLDPGLSVTSGAFVVNGLSIEVNASDSMNAVLDRINRSGAGVTAIFDAQTERVTVEAGAGGAQTIDIGQDSSGFLAAMKLDAASGAVSIPGLASGGQQRFADSPLFGGVVDGAFSINDVTIAVSRNDSLDDLLTRINAAGAGVSAAYDQDSDKVVLTPAGAGDTVDLHGDSSGFLALAGLASGAEATRVNAAGAFNGSGAAGPLFDDGQAVTAGTFKVNGVEVEVHADDSIDSVLARIGSSAAGVSASYDAGTETIRLQRTSPGSDPITLGEDTSGFLAATKLDGALVSTPGAASRPLSSFDAAIASTPPLAAVQAGTITINGQAVAVNPATQSVRDVFAALGRLPGVFTRLDDSGAVHLNSRQEGGALVISDTSGLLGRLQIASGTYQGRVGQLSPAALADVDQATGGVAEAVGALNEALTQLFPGGRPDSAAQRALRGSLNSAFSQLGQQLGSAVTFVDGGQPHVALDRKALDVALASTGTALEQKLGALQTLAELLAASRDLPAPVDAAATALPRSPEPAPRPPLVNPLAPPVPASDDAGIALSGQDGQREPWRIDPGLAAAVDRRRESGKSQLVAATVSGLRQSLEEAARLHEKRQAEQSAASQTSVGVGAVDDDRRSWTWDDDSKVKSRTGELARPGEVGTGGGAGGGQSKVQELTARRAHSAYERARNNVDAPAPAPSAPRRGSYGAAPDAAPRFVSRAV